MVPETLIGAKGSNRMSKKPLIGINGDFIAATHDRPAYSLTCAGYYDAVIAAGGIPVIIPPLEDADDLANLLDQLDGFVLTGGRDLDPRNDGFMLHPSVRPMDMRREHFDRTLCQMVCDRRMPLMAIGVGMQLLNVTMGGNLFLHIPEDLPKAIPHKELNDPQHRHGLVVVPNSLMELVYGDGEVRVNSMHHMSVDEVAPGFEITARCPDGVVEAIESRIEDWFVVGTQFHPEADSASALDIRIFEEFIFAIRGVPAEMRMVA
ncbi:MAG: gamma-glutamyl-gamma-aminobutyrate hydrolase family protein [Planctomycetales bacterium]|nr:gamma-glutamyl-gamma-aminobutyrate hydrolase family protein [Planctomycetales bacterium]